MSEYICRDFDIAEGIVRSELEQIVRCRDCIYSEPEREPNRPQYKGALWCDYLSEGVGFPVWPDCFCCWGERKADE